MDAENYTELYLHAVWATKHRLPLIDGDIKMDLYSAAIKKAEDLKSVVLAIGGVEDHMHLLLSLWPTVSVAHLVGEIKGYSAHSVNRSRRGEGSPFRWQGSYGALTIAKRDLGRVTDYIRRQREHHQTNRLWPIFEQYGHTDESPARSSTPHRRL
jgi:REP element-mobilizing transposase RayT